MEAAKLVKVYNSLRTAQPPQFQDDLSSSDLPPVHNKTDLDK